MLDLLSLAKTKCPEAILRQASVTASELGFSSCELILRQASVAASELGFSSCELILRQASVAASQSLHTRILTYTSHASVAASESFPRPAGAAPTAAVPGDEVSVEVSEASGAWPERFAKVAGGGRGGGRAPTLGAQKGEVGAQRAGLVV